NVSCNDDQLVQSMLKYNVEKSAVFFTDNELVRKAVQKYPDRLLGCYWPNPHEEDAAEKVKIALTEWGFKGIKLHPLFQAFLPNDKIVHPIIQEAVRAKVPVLIHTGHSPFSLPWSVGELAENFPDAKIVMLHMGDGHGVYMEAAINTAKRMDNIYLETSRMPNGEKIKEAMNLVGKDRVMYGSDIPFGDPVVEIVKATALELSEEEYDLYFYRNAKNLLNI
ncbi:MAG TPA: amidohydrolase family protein, partial [Nitrososphaerales archaeon]|nr:amidohydrolase family protein [Nitrososphaerales archaeon]